MIRELLDFIWLLFLLWGPVCVLVVLLLLFIHAWQMLLEKFASDESTESEDDQ